MKNKKLFKNNERQINLSEDFLEDVILNRAKGGEYVEISEVYELKPVHNLPMVCGALADKIIFPFGVISGLADPNLKSFTFEFFEGELEKVKNKKSEWFKFCEEDDCIIAKNYATTQNAVRKNISGKVAGEGKANSNAVGESKTNLIIPSEDEVKFNTAGESETNSNVLSEDEVKSKVTGEGKANSNAVGKSEANGKTAREKMAGECRVNLNITSEDEISGNVTGECKASGGFLETGVFCEGVNGNVDIERKMFCPKLNDAKNLEDMVCVKRKVSKKYNAPDMSAVKLLMELKAEKKNGMTGLASEIKNMTNAEIEKRKKELMEEILKG